MSASAASGGIGTSAAPFQSISACAAVAAPGDTCQIASGTYRETVSPANSGTSAAPITYAAAPGATVTVTGTNTVTGWTQSSGNIYSASVALSAGTSNTGYSSTQNPSNSDLWANQVFVNGVNVPEAQYPAPGTDPATPSYKKIVAISGSTITDTSLPNFGDLTGSTVYFTGGWVAISGTITSNSTANQSFTFSVPSSDDRVFPGTGTGASNNKQFRIVGKQSLLTQAGEWFYDPTAAKLYLWAPAGGAPTGVEAKARNYAFDLQGDHDITVKGITVKAATIRTDANSYDVTLDGLIASYLSQWQTAQYDSTVPYNGIYDINHKRDSGIVLAGHDNTITNSKVSYSMGNGLAIDGYNMSVQNNLITNVSYGGTYTSAVSIRGGSHDVNISQNTMTGSGRDMINMNTNIVAEQTYKNITISHNDITNYARLAQDLGGIYTCCNVNLQGSRIDHNWIHDPYQAGNGIHLDNGSYNITSIDHNVIWGLKGDGSPYDGGNGIAQGGSNGSNPLDLTANITNNTINVPGAYTVFTYYATSSANANQVLTNNILDGAGASRDLSGNANIVTQVSYNQTGPDPQYVNPAAGNFQLQTGSLAGSGGNVVSGITTSPAGSVQRGAYEGGAFTPGCTLSGCTQPNSSPTIPVAGHTYTMTARHSSKLVDAFSPQAGNATPPVVQNTANSSVSQRWRFITATASTFTIQNQQTGLCLTDPGASASPGTAMVLSACGAGVSQQFAAAAVTNGYNGVNITSAASGLCLDITGASTSDNAAVIQWGCGGQTNQQFQLTDSPLDSTTDLQAVFDGKNADVTGTSGSQVVQRTVSSDAGQAWSLIRGADGYYTFASLSNGQCLDASTTSNAIVFVSCSTAADQKWSLAPAATSIGYQLVSASSKLCIDVSGANTADGTGLIQWTCSGATNQQWALKLGPVVMDDAAVGTSRVAFTYTGSWGHASGETGLYLGTNSYSKTTGDLATFAFVGSRVVYTAVTAPNHGIVAVSIDGSPETTVDLYSSTRLGNQQVWTSPLLTPGAHTLVIRVTGTANAASSDKYGVVDAIQVSP